MKDLIKKISETYSIPYNELILLQKNLNNNENLSKKELPKDLSIPYYGVIISDQCKGIVYDHGLYTQCKVKSNNKFCKKCEKMKYGSIYDREKFEIGKFVCSNGKKEINYIEYLSKNNIDVNMVKDYFTKNNISYNLNTDSKNPIKSARGRPKKTKVEISKNDTINTHNSEEYKLDVEKKYIDGVLFYKTKNGLILDIDLKIVDIEKNGMN